MLTYARYAALPKPAAAEQSAYPSEFSLWGFSNYSYLSNPAKSAWLAHSSSVLPCECCFLLVNLVKLVSLVITQKYQFSIPDTPLNSLYSLISLTSLFYQFIIAGCYLCSLLFALHHKASSSSAVISVKSLPSASASIWVKRRMNFLLHCSKAISGSMP